MPRAKSKHQPVTRKFLLDLAKRIYDPKTRRFLRLCDGRLQNGPDPTNAQRPMHCGLGELYFAMTGTQPQDGRVSEDDVVNLAVCLSPLEAAEKAAQKYARTVIRTMDVPKRVQEELVCALSDCDFSEPEERFREVLDSIPSTNDDDCGDSSCSRDVFRRRSSRVASLLRKAAALLPV